MSTIQIVLIACMSLIAAYAFPHFKKNRVLILIVLLTAAATILFPDSLTRISRMVGVGRGADLLLYLSITGLLFLLVQFYKKIKALERKLTELIRYLAMHEKELEER